MTTATERSFGFGLTAGGLEVGVVISATSSEFWSSVCSLWLLFIVCLYLMKLLLLISFWLLEISSIELPGRPPTTPASFDPLLKLILSKEERFFCLTTGDVIGGEEESVLGDFIENEWRNPFFGLDFGLDRGWPDKSGGNKCNGTSTTILPSSLLATYCVRKINALLRSVYKVGWVSVNSKRNKL